jgi:hypothetical protein
MPVGMRDVDVIFLFPPGCPPISDIQRESKGATKAFVTFGSPTDAQAAFDMLDGRAGLDSRGRAQKLVRFQAGVQWTLVYKGCMYGLYRIQHRLPDVFLKHGTWRLVRN